ncbi:MAG: nitroreductase [Candidatus Aminicenantes bacterium RBG_13_63_10]|nr:MAG: nitroreductase [Candidatus Aminicenantes bacterium RBG_13_63_10]
MTILDVVRGRRSVRAFKPDPVPEEALGRALEAARLAPSAKNLQPWKFIVIRDLETRRRLAAASAGQSFMAGAPLIIAACGFPGQSYTRLGRYMNSWPVDVAIAFEHLILQAREDGLGTCWIGAFEEEAVKDILGVPAEVRVLALTPLGYPAESPAFRGRKSLEDIVSTDQW